MGAIAATAALAMLPATAAADDGVSVMQFKLPNREAAEQLIKAGFDLDDGLDQSRPGQILATIVVSPEEKAQLEARGYPAVATIMGPEDADARRAERQAAIDAEQAARAALDGSAGRKAKSAIAGTVRAQRADYWEDNGGRWLSVEGTTTQAAVTGSSYSGPQLVAAWYDANGAQIGSGNLSALLDPDVTPRAYLYHVSRYRLGAPGSGAMPASIRISAPNGDVATLPVKRWVGNGSQTHPSGFIQDFNTHYVDPQEGYARIRALAGEFSNISEIVDLPYKTPGYQRKSQTIVGMAAAYTGGTSVASADQGRAVILTAQAWGQEGGNDVTAQIVNPGAPSAPLTVSVTGKAITVSAATNASGAITSTAAQVVSAINADPAAAALVTASRYRTNAGATVVTAGAAPSKLSDFLNAPVSYPRGPQTVQMLRIGKTRDKSKVGVFIYCQEHAREWGTPLVCLETAERLLRNYDTDPETKNLVDNLDIFIVPTINADGAAYSMYDYASQRKNMVNYCASSPTGNNDPAARNTWGVDLNRNFSVGSYFDGYVGGSNSCTGETFSGPGELSEPEVRNETWVQSEFSNIKFAMNVHSSGGYFMWPPGAYLPNRTTLPYPPYGTLNYFDQTAAAVLDRIYDYRKTAVLPQQTGPVADVLYSAAGNSADEAYYNHGIIGYDFEIGASKVLANGSTAATGFQPCFGAVGTGGGAGNCNANLVNEGHDEGMEFSNGNYALLESALQYANDTAAPVSSASGASVSNVAQSVRFTTDEAAAIYYTTDGSTPTTASTEWKPNRPRELPDPLGVSQSTTLKWIAVDFKGNTSAVQTKSFLIETAAPSVTFTTPAAGAVYTQGRPVAAAFSCADEAGGSGVASCVGSTADGANLATGTPGTFTLTVTATDNAGNQTVATRDYTVIPATNVDSTVGGSVGATLSLTLGAPASFGVFTPGLARTYTASTTATVISTAGDAALSVADPSSVATGRLVNGTFALSQPLQGLGTVKTWAAPTSNEAVPVTFKQDIAANEPLRTGTYSKTLTFTLSTTTP